jgi:hypothetical protein
MPAWNRKIFESERSPLADPEYRENVAEAERLVARARTRDCGGDPQGEPVATYPPGHVSRMDDDGTLNIYKGELGSTADGRPSKLREAAERLKLSRTTSTNRNQRNQVLERAAASDKLATINQRNRRKP